MMRSVESTADSRTVKLDTWSQVEDGKSSDLKCSQDKASSLLIIELPPKVWRPKQQNKYIPLDYGDDIHDGHFDFSEHGKAVFRPPEQEWKTSERDDIIHFDAATHTYSCFYTDTMFATESGIWDLLTSLIKQLYNPILYLQSLLSLNHPQLHTLKFLQHPHIHHLFNHSTNKFLLHTTNFSSSNSHQPTLYVHDGISFKLILLPPKNNN